ncbi:hypothetical protein BDD43_2469 [Mucilaginibacter gracilis]|uniref:Uncharacterized protein n=1 Tax=Mucilaginibacter gracilis TaxID=423350 RepID=A0A495J0K5_9SPHI|nr:hypothetical protein [Mucilaginibacter gracilis]RKR82293.1 hypothetical protein BDD43_2469 [Mucilaginibacter gracilis]
MILTEEQEALIKEKLNYTVKFKETFDEVYDHVISTAEAADYYNGPDEIIEQEFGSYANLKAMEKARAKLLFKVMRKKHGLNMAYFFNWPVIIFTLAITIAGYFIAANPAYRRYLKLVTVALALAPILFVLFKKLESKYKAWRYDIYQKQSIKDNYIFIAAVLSNSLLNFVNFLNSNYVLYGSVVLFIFVCYSVYVLGFFRLYREEYHINIAQ